MVTDNANHLFVERHELTKLAELLKKIPALSVDLGIATTRQARLGGHAGNRKPVRPSEQPMPYDVDCAALADELHACLVSWVKLTCESRGMEFYPLGYVSPDKMGPLAKTERWLPPGYQTPTSALAKWLDRYIVALAMTPGAEKALVEIGHIYDAADRVTCPPTRPIFIDDAKLQAARKRRLNARGVSVLARELGEVYRNLSARRVQYLAKSGAIVRIPGPWDPKWPALYCVGDAMDAHLQVPIRDRHTGNNDEDAG